MQSNPTQVQKTVIEETITSTNAAGGVGYGGQEVGYGGQGVGYGGQGVEYIGQDTGFGHQQQQQYLGENQVYGQQ